MNCRDFQKHIHSFLNYDDMSEETLEEFLDHAAACKECYDELEIYYILQVGLDQEDKALKHSFDFKSGLEQMLRNTKKELDFIRRFTWIRHTTVISAEVLTVVSLLLCIWHLL